MGSGGGCLIPTANGSPLLRRALLWTVGGGVAAVILFALLGDWTKLGPALTGFPVPLLLLAGGFSLLNYLLRFLKWHWFLDRLGFAPPPGMSAEVFLAGFALTVTPGKVGEFVKAVLLHRGRGTPYGASLSVLLLDRFLDFGALFLLAGLGLTLGKFSPALLLLPLGAMAAGLLLLRHRGAMGWVLGFLRRRFPRAGAVERLESLYHQGLPLLGWEVLLGGLALSVAAWAAEGYGFFLVARHFGGTFGPGAGVFIYAAATVGGALSLLPGGLGVTEGGLAALAVAFGMTAAGAVGAAMVCRLLTLWLAVALGWGVFALSPRLRKML